MTGLVCTISDTGLITTVDGLMLPSATGTPTKLDYNGKETILFHMTGAVTPAFDFPVTFNRVGNTVTMQWDEFHKARTGSDIMFTAELVPTRFLPVFGTSDTPLWVVHITDGATLTSFSTGVIGFGSGQNIVLAPISLGNFGNIFVGLSSGSITYIVP